MNEDMKKRIESYIQDRIALLPDNGRYGALKVADEINTGTEFMLSLVLEQLDRFDLEYSLETHEMQAGAKKWAEYLRNKFGVKDE